MSSKWDFNNDYKVPTNEYIYFSLTYDQKEDDRSFINNPSDSFLYGTPTTEKAEEYIGKNKNSFIKNVVKLAFMNKEKLKRIPLLGKHILAIKKRMLDKAILEERISIPRIDLSTLMELDINSFIFQLYINALGRIPDEEGMNIYKGALCSGASKEAIAYIICTSKEFGNRALVIDIDKYHKAYKRYLIRSRIRKVPIIAFVWSLLAMPRRLFRLEIDERIREVDRSTREKQKSEELEHQYRELYSRVDTLFSGNLSKINDISNRLDSIISEKAESTGILSCKIDSIIAENSKSAKILSSRIDILDKFGKEKFEELSVSLATANANILNENVKLDDTAKLIIETSVKGKSTITSVPGGVIAIYLGNYIFGVPSEEWRLAMFLSMNGFFECGSEKYFCSIINSEMNVLDIGANLGIYTLHALSAGCHVFAYEPTPRTYNILLENITVNGFEPTGRAKAYNLLVSDIEGMAEFTVYDNLSGHNTMFSKNIGDNKIHINSVTLDSHLSHLTHIDVVKIDVEGAEPLVLRGMKGIISNNSKIKIIMEFAPDILRRGGFNPSEFIKEIYGMGFGIKLINDNTGMLNDITDEELCNAFSVNLLLQKD